MSVSQPHKYPASILKRIEFRSQCTIVAQDKIRKSEDGARQTRKGVS